MVFNEISLKQQVAKSPLTEQFSGFLKVCQELKHRNKDNDFYYTDELMTEEIANEYTIHDWLKDRNVPQKDKQFFRSLIQRGHRIETGDFLESELIVELENEGSISAKGALMAYEWDSYIVSLLSSELWEKEWMEGKYVSINDEEDEAVKVRNCGILDHVDQLITSERERQSLIISSGAELWEKREQLYPHLIFCKEVKRQLEEARVSIQIQTIMKRIQILEDYFATYEGVFDKNEVGFGCRTESESVKKDKELNEYRKFVTPYGKEEYFYWHISFPGNYPGRIHFLPDPEHRVGIVGYIGKHLPTSKFSTI